MDQNENENKNENENIKKNKNKKKNTSSRNRNLFDKTIQYYEKRYMGSKLLPRTPIFNYMFNNFNNYEKEKNQKEIPFTLEDAFSLSDPLKNINERMPKIKIEEKLSSNPNVSLDKFIAYCFYITDSAMFKDMEGELSINSFIENVKNQAGKDVQRTEMAINNKIEDNEIYSRFKSNNYLKADFYIKNILIILNEINKIIDYNLLNKIILLTCQNIFNAMVSMLNLFIQEKFQKLDRFVIMLPLESKKSLTLNKTQFVFNVYFKSSLLISNYMGDIDPEKSCGTLEYNLVLDLKNSTYECNAFNIEWDLSACSFYKPEPEALQALPACDCSGNRPRKELKDFWKDPKVGYALAASAAATGIVATPFLLGGRTKKKKVLRKTKKTTRKRDRKKIKCLYFT